LGAGTTIAAVRRSCESAAWPLIRINPQDTEPPRHGVLLPVGALAGLTRLAAVVDADMTGSSLSAGISSIE